MLYFLILVIIIVAVVIYLGLVVGLVARLGGKTDAAWASAARRLQVQHLPGNFTTSPRLEGRVKGQQVVVDTVRRSTGGGSATFTRYRVQYPRSLKLGLNVSRAGVASNIGRLLGAKDIRTGDQDFDRAFVVKGNDNRRVAAYLTPQRRQRLKRLLTTVPETVVDDEGIECLTRGRANDAGHIAFLVQQMAALGSSLSGEPVEKRRGGAPAGPQPERTRDEAPPEAERPWTIQYEWATPPADADAEDGGAGLSGEEVPSEPERDRRPEPATGRAETEPEAPGAPDAAQVEDTATDADREESEPAPAPVPAPETTPEPAPVTVSEGDLSSETVCRMLFGTPRGTLEAGGLFEDHCEGREVRWSGVLERVDEEAYDFAFGIGTGTRAVFTIQEAEEGMFTGDKVHAVVRLPPEAADTLRPLVGERLVFEGRLVSCGVFSRDLYVADGRIVG